MLQDVHVLLKGDKLTSKRTNKLRPKSVEHDARCSKIHDNLFNII